MSTENDYRGEERRESARAQGALVVRMRFPRIEDFRYRYTRDISRGGVFIQTAKPKPSGSNVVLVLEPAGQNPVSIQGEVVTSITPEEGAARQLQPGMGIRFLDLDDAKRQVIEGILAAWEQANLGAQAAPHTQTIEQYVQGAGRVQPHASSQPVTHVDRPLPDQLATTMPFGSNLLGHVEQVAPVPSVAAAAPPAPALSAPARGSMEDLAELQIQARAYLARMEVESHYALLGVSPDASFAELRRAFLKLTKRFHPDNYFRKAPEALARDLEDIYNQLTAAYETLADRDRRQVYDLAIGNLGGNKDGVTAEDMARVASDERRRKAAPGRVSKADQLLALAVQDITAGNKAKALANLRLALAFDPENPAVKAKLDELKGKR